jgi:1-deoxy-D-xylulose-5-phosphate reductoisomerase
MVQFHDASVMAQLGTPDMRVPIAYGLSWPERIESGTARLDFARMAAMTFEVPDFQRFPCLPLAWESLRAPPGTCVVLNAANEVAVAAFLDKRIRFDHIHRVNHATLEAMTFSQVTDIESLLALDEQARRAAVQIAGKLDA